MGTVLALAPDCKSSTQRENARSDDETPRAWLIFQKKLTLLGLLSIIV
jgi:hypothetical protein